MTDIRSDRQALYNSSFRLNMQIDGTPTTRIFHPNTPINLMDSSYYGFDIPVKNGKEYYVNIILYNIAVASSEEGNININFLPRR